MRRSLALQLTEFGTDAIARKASALGISVEALLQEAVLYYLAESHADRAAWRVPRFARTSAAPPDRELDVQLVLADADWDELEAEAALQGVSPARLVQHAALLYLSSELDEEEWA